MREKRKLVFLTDTDQRSISIIHTNFPHAHSPVLAEETVSMLRQSEISASLVLVSACVK